MLRYRCRVGHAYTVDAVLAAKNDEVDRILGRLLRLHEERAALAQRMLRRETMQGHHHFAAQFEARAEEYARDAKLVRRLLLDHNEEAKLKISDSPQGVESAHGQGKQ